MTDTQEPIDYLKELLGIPEYTELNSIATEAIDEIETLRKAVDETPTQRELKFMARLNKRDEEHSQAFAEWLEERSEKNRDSIAARRIYEIMLTATTGYLHNFVSATDGNGNTINSTELNWLLTKRVTQEFTRITGISTEVKW